VPNTGNSDFGALARGKYAEQIRTSSNVVVIAQRWPTCFQTPRRSTLRCGYWRRLPSALAPDGPDRVASLDGLSDQVSFNSPGERVVPLHGLIRRLAIAAHARRRAGLSDPRWQARGDLAPDATARLGMGRRRCAGALDEPRVDQMAHLSHKGSFVYRMCVPQQKECKT
jgi:hypothetical protein